MVGSGEAAAITLPPMVRVDDEATKRDDDDGLLGMVGTGCSVRMKKRDDDDGEPTPFVRVDTRRGDMPPVSSRLYKPVPAAEVEEENKAEEEGEDK